MPIVPELQTNRFLLQEIFQEDLPFIFEGFGHPVVGPSVGVQYSTLEETQVMLDFYQKLQQTGRGIWWKIVEKESLQKLGSIGFTNLSTKHKKTEVGYWLLPQFWKRGIISETLPAVVRYLQQERDVHRIESLVEESNEASCNLLRKAGFVNEGILRDYEFKNQRPVNFVMFSLISADKYNSKNNL